MNETRYKKVMIQTLALSLILFLVLRKIIIVILPEQSTAMTKKTVIPKRHLLRMNRALLVDLLMKGNHKRRLQLQTNLVVMKAIATENQ